MNFIKTIVLVTLIFTSTVFASDKKAELMNDMKSMLKAMEKIQSSGLYSDQEGVKEGVSLLMKSTKKLSTDDVKYILPKELAYAYAFAKKRAKMINMYADDLIDSINNGKMDDALEDYSMILRECSSCHSRIRSW